MHHDATPLLVGFFRRALLSGVGALIFLPSIVSAVPDLPTGTGAIPDLSKGAKGGAIVSSAKVSEYQSVLPPEVADLVAQGELAF